MSQQKSEPVTQAQHCEDGIAYESFIRTFKPSDVLVPKPLKPRYAEGLAKLAVVQKQRRCREIRAKERRLRLLQGAMK
ncbi:uncharacterized protein UHOD_12051 [Ustilago sp. UG-2017b]|nr:uncharacterized protein UHOD_12051 [Ustilago sp. UG-2017b]